MLTTNVTKQCFRSPYPYYYSYPYIYPSPPQSSASSVSNPSIHSSSPPLSSAAQAAGEVVAPLTSWEEQARIERKMMRHHHRMMRGGGPSRLFWFIIGAGTATWWLHHYHRHHPDQVYDIRLPSGGPKPNVSGCTQDQVNDESGSAPTYQVNPCRREWRLSHQDNERPREMNVPRWTRRREEETAASPRSGFWSSSDSFRVPAPVAPGSESQPEFDKNKQVPRERGVVERPTKTEVSGLNDDASKAQETDITLANEKIDSLMDMLDTLKVSLKKKQGELGSADFGAPEIRKV